MISRKQISKTSASRKVLTEGLEHNDRLDITDLLELEKETIDNIIENIQTMSIDPATENYIYELVSISDMVLNNICTDFLGIDFF